MDNTEYLNVIETFQHCQRNWDHSKTIDDETIDFLMEVGYNVPTKQNLYSYKIICIKDRDEIRKWASIARNSDETVHWTSEIIQQEIKDGVLQNPQTDANLLFLFFVNGSERTSKRRRDRERGPDPSVEDWKKIKNLEIGLAASAIGIAANMKGMRSGFCGCIWREAIPNEWIEGWGVDADDLSVMFGIGYPLLDEHNMFDDNKHSKYSFPKANYEKIIV